jgi:hypothetical protein
MFLYKEIYDDKDIFHTKYIVKYFCGLFEFEYEDFDYGI